MPISHTNKNFESLCIHFPDFSTSAVHRNYVDCVRWWGDLVLSKSTDSKIVCWRPGSELSNSAELQSGRAGKKEDFGDPMELVFSLEYDYCNIWYVRFCIDRLMKLVAAGNQYGKVYVWDLDSNA